MTAVPSQIRVQTLPRRGLSRHEAATYLGVSVTLFDRLREGKQIAPPKIIGTRKLWDIRDLDMAFDALPVENAPQLGTGWEDI